MSENDVVVSQTDEDSLALNTAQAPSTIVLEEEKYQIAPAPQNMFKPLRVRTLVEDLLKDKLNEIDYNPNTVPQLTSTLAVDVKNLLRTMGLPRYKFMVQVVIGESKGTGMRIGARCLWDPKTDSATEAVFHNDNLYCCVSIFAIYVY